jgi:hypothetical protein
MDESFLSPTRTVVLGMFPLDLAQDPGRRFGQLAAEAAAVTLVASTVSWIVAGAHAGLVAVFLVSAALSDRVVGLLEENRIGIWVRNETGWQANGRTAAGLIALFTGILLVDLGIAFALGQAGREVWFGFGERTGSMAFGSFVPLLAHNLNVLLTAVVLGFLFRAYGGMLALAWNAGVWSSVLVSTAESTEAGPWVLVAVAPHLALETTAYVLGVLAAIFAGKAVLTHDSQHSKLSRALLACGVLLAISVGLLALGAAVESRLPAFILG